MKRQLWEILVPVCWPDGKRIDLTTHQLWDSHVFANGSVGYTRMKIATGLWEGIREEVIPVRFTANKREAKMIAGFTKKYYRQRTVMYYKLSSEVYFT